MKSTESNPRIRLRFDGKSFIIFLIILAVEVCIALFVDDRIIRPYGGDVLAVMLVYYFAKTFVKTKTIWLVTAALLFAFLIEIGQYFNMVEIVMMENNKVIRTILGSSFSWGDILAYTLGAAICYLIDHKQ